MKRIILWGANRGRTSFRPFVNLGYSHNMCKKDMHTGRYLCLNNDKRTLNKFANLKNIHLKKNTCTGKVEIFIDDLILLTNGKNVLSFESFDLCFLIKYELLRNREKMDLQKMPLTLTANNFVDFLEGVIPPGGDDTHIKSKDKQIYFQEQRMIMENKIFENFQNDLILYQNGQPNMMDRVKKLGGSQTIDLPKSLNYVENYEINNLMEEENNVYTKFISIFENIHGVKLRRANHFETPVQDLCVQEKIKNLLKNMNSSDIFLFYKCTQILNSFVFSYLFLHGYIGYKDVYRCCNLEYIYQFFKWGYVYDVHGTKDAGALLALSSLSLVRVLLHQEVENNAKR
ncbi:conserved Plasmodium protein, unknown function [Plasmodium knowlesi strain H]|uniref:ATP synthase mitochondrial F1 complex assembly factor 2 n=3 Tax=Plasmodium knowlesi TaxID=5850 RepID=A0A5K1VFP4_PLAKH|nr:ATP synthase mitochondrial F1 complex assembly factor 2, putative [Plasmodium knowlesi strain H]OTN68320.1 Uncharacterized protein PKNOH_S03324500 [Plasmodium knowlesi]CAA9987147.1 ATP synthase mitochondrial F1 complex assembly factor 2, putative [Plasmodium knowlesi strain H]SBO23901.1 conserved Plasmodium protein, unknown function [Plasmodium knowlesi strain H]SBO25759.1 conserved Plasmodium protein, unknown function [Plasmodium knowlesi strain H]VVS76621.1 ATP synthase mitochondrial F1 c|eukprot:XP_002261769.1 hypothetical protein, conserved in Plasmodium species [Plasmodium knowlesi strain H]